MSKRLSAKITCPNCGNQFDYLLYRTIWGEDPANRELVMSDQINVATCNACRKPTKLQFPFMFTNAKQFFAIWWEPEFDPQIDVDSEMYTKMLGQDNYLATAPRIKDWQQFKETISKFERGEFKGKPGTPGKEMQDQMQNFITHIQKKDTNKKGCLATFICFVFISIFSRGRCSYNKNRTIERYL